MQTKDYITIIVSSLALTISMISLVISLIQKNNETKRNIRKVLSDTLEQIAKIGIEFSKLTLVPSDPNLNSKIEQRRWFNSQRRILIAHADFLAQKYEKITTEIDCNLIAGAYSAIGDHDKARKYWTKTIDKSLSKPIKHMNLRGFGNFLFHQGQFQLGRSKYDEALKIELDDTDDNRRLITDTYLMFATVERDFNNIEESKRLKGLAEGFCKRIGNRIMREQMESRIYQTFNEPIL